MLLSVLKQTMFVKQALIFEEVAIELLPLQVLLNDFSFKKQLKLKIFILPFSFHFKFNIDNCYKINTFEENDKFYNLISKL